MAKYIVDNTGDNARILTKTCDGGGDPAAGVASKYAKHLLGELVTVA